MNTQKYSISVVTIAMEEKHALIYGKCLLKHYPALMSGYRNTNWAERLESTQQFVS